jgi:hypothetical protein
MTAACADGAGCAFSPNHRVMLIVACFPRTATLLAQHTLYGICLFMLPCRQCAIRPGAGG